LLSPRGLRALTYSTLFGLLGATTLLVVIGLLDDRFDLDAPTKFAGQAMAAGILAWQGIGFIWLPLGNATVLDPLTSTGLTLLVVLVCINAVNFVDGLDGLASGIVLVGAAASFVYSYLLSVNFGFERATLSLAALALPLADFGMAVIRRTARGTSPMTPDREHMHHRLLDLGHSPRAAAALMHAGAAILAFSTVALAFVDWKYVAIVCAVSLALLAAAIFHRPDHEDA